MESPGDTATDSPQRTLLTGGQVDLVLVVVAGVLMFTVVSLVVLDPSAHDWQGVAGVLALFIVAGWFAVEIATTKRRAASTASFRVRRIEFRALLGGRVAIFTGAGYLIWGWWLAAVFGGLLR